MNLTISIGNANYHLQADNYKIYPSEDYESHGGWIDISKVWPAKIRDEYLNYIGNTVNGPFSFWCADKYTECVIVDNLSANILDFFKNYSNYHIISIECELVRYKSDKYGGRMKSRLVIKKLFVEQD